MVSQVSAVADQGIVGTITAPKAVISPVTAVAQTALGSSVEIIIAARKKINAHEQSTDYRELMKYAKACKILEEMQQIISSFSEF